MFLRQATASQSRLVGPFVDDTDFKTAKTGLTIANTDIKLSINGAAGASKNSGGGTHRNNGLYGVTFDATDTATVGELVGSVVVASALPVAFKYFVVEEAVYDALFVAAAPGYVVDQPVNVTKAAGTAWGSGAITAASIASAALSAAKFAADTGLVPVRSATAQAGAATTITLDASASAVDNFYLNDLIYLVSGTGAGQARFITGYVGSTKVATVTTWVTNPDNTSVFAILPSDGTTIALPTNFSSLSIDGSGRVDVAKVAGTAQTARDLGATLGVAGAGLTALGDTRIANLDAAVTTRLAPTSAGRTLDVSAGGEAGVDWANVGSPTSTVGLSGTTIATTQAIASVSGNVGGSVASIATGGIAAASFAAGAIDNAAIAADAIGSSELAASAVDEILDDQLADSIPADGTLPTVRQALYMLTQFMFERSVASTTVTVKKADGSTSLFTLTLNDGTTPTSITRAT